MTYDRRAWLKGLVTVRGSVLPNILPRLILVGVSAAVSIELHAAGHVPTLPPTFHALLGTALALLVTFRTNTAYERFWEGRKAWGMIVNRARSLTINARASLSDSAQAVRIARLVAAFAHSAKRELWKSADTSEVERILGSDGIPALACPPGFAQRTLLAIAKELSRARAEGHFDFAAGLAAQEDLTSLLDQLGACQRIQKTPIPLAYAIHLRWMLVIYCVTLPFALIATLDGAHVIVVVLFISFSLFGIEQIGVEIEDPFERTANDLDLEMIATTIERDVLALAREAQ